MTQELVSVTEKNAVVVSKLTYTSNTKVKQKVLEEEEYLSILESIVERDFYPELTKLKLRSSYIDALGSNDLEKLRQIQLQLEEGNLIRGEGSPDKFEDNDELLQSSKTKEKSVNPQLTLDKFLFKNTSEDNASFEKIMQLTRDKHKEKYAWLHTEQKLICDELATSRLLPSSNEEQLKLVENKSNSSVNTWPYVPRNTLMYPPDGVELSGNEIVHKKGKKEQEICHENTRFKNDPFDSAASQTSLVQASLDRANMQKAVGKVGVDGKLEQPAETPNVLGYGFVATPSPMPGANNESPFMTWGAIEGTPLRLDATPAHLSQGPNFKIAEPPRREQLAHSLAEKASKQHRDKRRKALARATSSIFSPKSTPRTCGTSSDRLSKLTPAAQKLIKSNRTSVHTDKSLRASYTPTPTNNKKNTAILTPNVKTPGTSRTTKTPGSERGSSITDNLLHIPDS